jgi:DNA polymerase-1
MPKLVLVDGSNLAFRSFHAIRSGMSTKAGFPTNALYGFAMTLIKVVRLEQPSHMAVVFDPPGPTFRHDRFPDYKGHRPDMPEDLAKQWPRFEDLTTALGMAYLALPGYEADDVIGTLAHRHASAALPAVIVSGDKDLWQLINEHVTVVDPRKQNRAGVQDVVARFRAEPLRVPDVLGLWGDAVDNIPGVRGVGEKRATGLIETYGSIEGVYEHIDEVKGKLRENLVADRERAMLSRELATVAVDAPVQEQLDDLEMNFPPGDTALARKVLEEFEFRSLAQQLVPSVDRIAGAEYRLVVDEDALARVLEGLAEAEQLAVDTETTDLRPTHAELVGISLCWEPGVAWYVPVGHCEGEQLSRERVLEALRPVLEDPAVPKVGQHIKYDQVVLARAGIHLRGVSDDTLLLDVLLRPGRRGHKLDILARDYLGHEMIAFDEVVKSKGRKLFSEVPLDEATEYAAEDALATWHLQRHLRGALAEEPVLERLYLDLELPLSDVLARLERAGILLDVDHLEQMSDELAGWIDASATKIWTLAGHEFNLNSPKQVATVLFDELGLPVQKKTSTGPSTDAQVLRALSEMHPIPKELLVYREHSKLKSTYVDVLPGLVHPDNGRLHTSYSQVVAATGRLSSSDPNLQNIPIRTPEGRKIREAFIAPDGHLLLSVDYSQIELRVLAHLCGGEGGFATAFREGADIHRRTAAEIFDVAEALVSPDMRRTAKAINFGLIYGQGAFGLARTLGISRAKARTFIEAYFEHYPEVQEYMDRTIHEAKEKGYTETIFGRRRPFSFGGGSRDRRGDERAAINAPVQGSAADIIKRAMIDIDALIRDKLRQVTMVLQVHDELLFEVPEDQVEELTEILSRGMERAVELHVPVIVSASSGRNWGEAH